MLSYNVAIMFLSLNSVGLMWFGWIIVDWIVRTMRKVEALEKLVLSNLQSSFIPVMSDNVIQLCEGEAINEDAIQSDYQIEDKYSRI